MIPFNLGMDIIKSYPLHRTPLNPDRSASEKQQGSANSSIFVTSMSIVPDALRESVRLRATGRAQEALSNIKLLSTRTLSPQEKRAVAAETFDILYSQGLCRKAETVVRKAIAVSSQELWRRNSEEECWMHAVLRAKRILIQLHTTGTMNHLMRQWKELVGRFPGPSERGNKNESSVGTSIPGSIINQKGRT